MAKEKSQSKSINLGAKASKKNNISMTRDDITYYKEAKVSCACGATYATGSTLPEIRVDICSNCHPFFTGENRILDAEGRVEKFRKKYKLSK